jgi:RHS repeat-associated protein
VHDEVGSVIATVTENVGGSNQALTLNSYDAWGKARPTTGTAAYQDPDPGIYLNPTQAGQHEGYADHENLDDVGLVDMEGRVYDPEVGRFLSPDPNVQYPDSSQGYDRYTYVNDNPLSASDPSGYFMLGGMLATGDPMASVFPQQYGQAIGIAGPIVGAALNDVPYCEAWCDYVVTAVSQAQAGYLETGSLGAGLKAGVIAGAEAYAFSYVGGQFGANPEGGALLERSVIEGVIGGTFSAAGGGRFSDGFLGSFASSETASWVDSVAPSNEAARVVMSAVLGGTISKLSGGNFANGAVAAAFQRLFNDELHRINESRLANINKEVAAKAQMAIDMLQAEYGIDVEVEKGAYRSFATEDAKFAAGLSKVHGGWSWHNYGLAVDVVEMVNHQPDWSYQNLDSIRAAFGSMGFKYYSSGFDPGHFYMPLGNTLSGLYLQHLQAEQIIYPPWY